MISVGIPKEVKANEYRVSMTPNDVSELVNAGICVYVQMDAGIGANFSNKEYVDAGALICKTIEDVYKFAILIVKVKEPQPEEYDLIKDRHIVFTFFHFASSPQLIQAMINSKATCIAYETLKDNNGKFPILAEMSIIAGEQSILEAKKFKFSFNNNYDYTYDEITIIGVGNVGKAAAYKAKELNYKTINLIDMDYEKIKDLEKEGFIPHEMNNYNLSKLLMRSDIVVGSIYVDGEKAKKLIINDLLVIMPKDSIFMDVAIDQGGMTQKSKPTTITNPLIKYHNTYIYCVPNIPSSVPNKASINLSKVITPFVISIANENIDDVINTGININNGKIIHPSLIKDI
jgi:alanine dehydrogenase